MNENVKTYKENRKAAIKCPLDNDMIVLKIKNGVAKDLRNAKAEYYISVIRDIKTHYSAICKQMNSLIG